MSEPDPAGATAVARPLNLLLAEVALAAVRLAEAGVDSPRADAEELAAWVHGVRRGELHTVRDGDFDARFWEAVARRESREPLQHITGRAFFRYLELEVGPGSSSRVRRLRSWSAGRSTGCVTWTWLSR